MKKMVSFLAPLSDDNLVTVLLIDRVYDFSTTTKFCNSTKNHFLSLQVPPCTPVSPTECKKKSQLWPHRPSRSKSSLHQKGNTPYGSVVPSWPPCPPSNRCGSRNKNTTNQAQESSTVNVSKHFHHHKIKDQNYDDYDKIHDVYVLSLKLPVNFVSNISFYTIIVIWTWKERIQLMGLWRNYIFFLFFFPFFKWRACTYSRYGVSIWYECFFFSFIYFSFFLIICFFPHLT